VSHLVVTEAQKIATISGMRQYWIVHFDQK
jgi:hypothetical protein